MHNVLLAEAPSAPSTLRVVVVDPRPERRTLTRLMLGTGDGAVSVVGEAGTREEAMEVLEQQAVDAVVLEIQMPLLEGLRTIADIRERAPGVGIIVVSFLDDHHTRELATQAGADGFMQKPVSARELVGVISARR